MTTTMSLEAIEKAISVHEAHHGERPASMIMTRKQFEKIKDDIDRPWEPSHMDVTILIQEDVYDS